MWIDNTGMLLEGLICMHLAPLLPAAYALRFRARRVVLWSCLWGAVWAWLGWPTPVLALQPIVPGQYTVVITGQLQDGRHFARLAFYTFAGEPGATMGTIRQEFYYWDSRQPRRFALDATGEQVVPCPAADTALDFGSTGQALGCVNGDCTANPQDADRALVVSCDFWYGRMQQLSGTWLANSDRRIRVDWPRGNREIWQLTWYDEASTGNLYKIELVTASYLAGLTTFDGFQRHYTPNAGWGFGAPGVKLDGHAADALLVMTHPFLGHVLTWNPTTQGTALEVSGLTYQDAGRTLDPTGNVVALRLPVEDTTPTGFRCPGADVLSYFSRPAPQHGLLNRRVFYQVSHDYDCDGHLSERPAHVWSGHQILDSGGNVRGFVFAESTYTEARHDDPQQIGGAFYLDVLSCDALIGVDPDRFEACPEDFSP